MARTNSTAVEALLMKDYDPDWSVASAIETASVMVDNVVACASRKNVTLSTTNLEILERWLAAHYYSVSDRPYEQKRTQQSWAKYQGKTGMGLESSHYGQTALGLDPSGCLEAINAKARAGVFWVGKTKSEEISYEDRN
jgi:hypothetical protein